MNRHKRPQPYSRGALAVTRNPSQPCRRRISSSSGAMIAAEVQANNIKVRELADEQGLKTTQNVAAGVAGIFVPVIWFGMDFKGAADKEVAALQARQQYLAMLASERCRK